VNNAKRKDATIPTQMSTQKIKIRLDTWLVDQHQIPSREVAQALIITGKVIVNNEKVTKPGTLIKQDADIHLLSQKTAYVSRGGEKLAGAHRAFNFQIKDRVILDAGISTGGFTDYLLQNGAKAVIGIDVGYGQVAHKIATDPRVTVIERTNIREISKEDLNVAVSKKNPAHYPFKDDISLVVMDLSFISVRKVVENVTKLVRDDAEWVILIKPQFEGEKHQIGKGGIVRDEKTRQEIVDCVKIELEAMGLVLIGQCESPITGTKGNQEYFFHLSANPKK